MNSQQLYSLIYDSTINPNGYNALISAWNDYLELQSHTDELGASSPRDTNSANNLIDIQGHLERAEAILDQIGRSHQTLALPKPPAQIAIAISEDGRVVASNAPAQKFFGADVGLATLYDACDADSASRLRQALRAMGECRPGQFLTLLTLPADKFSEMATQYLAITLRNDLYGRRKVLALNSLTIPWTRKLAAELVSIFKLTPAEVELTQLLVEGLSLYQTATFKGRSIETIRVQLKAIFSKTYSRTQTELVRTVMMLATIIETAEQDTGLTLHKNQVDRVILPDGRKMTVHSFGDERGAPVLFLHGMMDAFGGPKMMDASLRKAGLRFICPARAGFGQSEPISTSGKDAQKTVTADLLFLAEHLALKDSVIVSHMSGGAYAFSLANVLADDVAGVVNISGAVPIRKRSQIRAMAPRQRVIALTARYCPNILPPLLRIGMSQIDTEHCVAFVNALFEGDTPDRSLIESLSLYSILADQYRWSTSEGYEGFRLDSSIVTSNWFGESEATKCQVSWLHGCHDPVVKHNTAEQFAGEINNANFYSFPEDGQLLLYRHPERVIAEILKCL